MDKYVLKLFVVGRTHLAEKAIANMNRILEAARMGPDSEFQVIDLLDRPDLAENEQILATPVLIRYAPGPKRHIIGDLSDIESVMFGLDIPYTPSIR